MLRLRLRLRRRMAVLRGWDRSARREAGRALGGCCSPGSGPGLCYRRGCGSWFVMNGAGNKYAACIYPSMQRMSAAGGA